MGSRFYNVIVHITFKCWRKESIYGIFGAKIDPTQTSAQNRLRTAIHSIKLGSIIPNIINSLMLLKIIQM